MLQMYSSWLHLMLGVERGELVALQTVWYHDIGGSACTTVSTLT